MNCSIRAVPAFRAVSGTVGVRVIRVVRGNRAVAGFVLGLGIPIEMAR